MTGAALTLDLVVRDGADLDAAISARSRAALWPRRLAGLALLGLSAHGLVLGLAFDFALHHQAGPVYAWPLALCAGFVGAAGLCLPMLYVLTRVAGFHVSAAFVAVQALRGLARTAALLLGLVPLYLAAVLAVPRGVLEADLVIEVGLCLPFALGLFGLVTLYRVFQRMVAARPADRPARPGTDIKLALAWGATFMSVAPLLCLRVAGALTGLV